MRKSIMFMAIGAASFLMPAAAQAYCCKSHPAICQAICGSACCEKASNRLSSGGNSAMTPISTRDIEAELKSAKSGGGQDFAKALQAELDRRKAAAPARIKTN